MVEDNNPLVSINVITYNSSKFVLETLESAKAQTYQNIELIVSDDCSTDNTVDICREWIEKNKDRFVRTELITVEKNTGIAANCNRAVKASKGEWIKGIAGDDRLKSDCVNNNIEFINLYDDVQIIHSNSDYYKNDLFKYNYIGSRDIKKEPLFNNLLTSKEQYKFLLIGCYINTPTVFVKRSVIIDNNFYDETIPMLEDWPMWLKISKKGNKFYYLNKHTVDYRVHDKSISNVKSTKELISVHKQSVNIVYKKYINNDIILCLKITKKYFVFIDNLFISIFKNKKTCIVWFLYMIFSYSLSILYNMIIERYKLKLIKRFNLLLLINNKE